MKQYYLTNKFYEDKMKNKSLIFFVSLLALLFYFNGCDKADDNPVSPGTGGTSGNQSGQPIPAILNTNGTLVAISFGYTVPGLPISVDYVMGYALLGLPNGVDAGTVAVNGNNLTKSTQGSVIYYNSFSSTNPTSLQNVLFDGSSAHNWNISGGNGIPSFTASLIPPKDFNITKPTAGSNVTKSGGLEVKWSTVGSSASDSIMIVVAGSSGTPYTSSILSNSGTYQISAASISSISGDAVLQVVKFRYTLKTADNKNYAVIAEIVKTVNIVLV
jgi:hypothetical protein